MRILSLRHLGLNSAEPTPCSSLAASEFAYVRGRQRHSSGCSTGTQSVSPYPPPSAPAAALLCASCPWSLVCWAFETAPVPLCPLSPPPLVHEPPTWCPSSRLLRSSLPCCSNSHGKAQLWCFQPAINVPECLQTALAVNLKSVTHPRGPTGLDPDDPSGFPSCLAILHGLQAQSLTLFIF